jgi:hypothetical protein
MLLTEKEAAAILGTTVPSLRTLRCTGAKPGGRKIPPYIKMGKSVRYDAADLQRYIDAHRQGGAA